MFFHCKLAVSPYTSVGMGLPTCDRSLFVDQAIVINVLKLDIAGADGIALKRAGENLSVALENAFLLQQVKRSDRVAGFGKCGKHTIVNPAARNGSAIAQRQNFAF